MPTYDYRCDACRHEMEVFQSMSADRLTECPACGEAKLRRLIGSGAGIIFKGSGFYETDYKRSRTSPGQPSEKKSETKSETKSKTKSESKSDSSKKKSDD
jgi:putative FmdB family regulatory protein